MYLSQGFRIQDLGFGSLNFPIRPAGIATTNLGLARLAVDYRLLASRPCVLASDFWLLTFGS